MRGRGKRIAERAKDLARRLKIEIRALYCAYCNPKTPWYAKAWAAVVIAYALSPIDLIPDFIPVIGYLDDLVLIPLGVALAIRLVPRDVWVECRTLVEEETSAPRVFMAMAIDEARRSLRQGNHGFGAVIVRDGTVIARAYDRDETSGDPTAHAELLAIRAASRVLGKSLSGCRLYCTHEPCPMCAAAAVWSGLDVVSYGYGIEEAMAQGRTRIGLPCREMFRGAGARIEVEEGLLHDECAVLYDADIRREVKRLRGARDTDLSAHDRATAEKRVAWARSRATAEFDSRADTLMTAYRLFLGKLGITADEAPIMERDDHRIVIGSRNKCPTLEACRILGLDTRRVCRLSSESAMRAMMKAIDPRLSFTRDYGRLRPRHECCVESITLDQNAALRGQRGRR